MSQGLVERQNLEDIADAIRSKNGSSDTYTPAEMAQAISGIHTADEVVLVQKTVNANGQYNASDDSADGYSGVRVNVPNSYSASDEGKVVSNSTLVAQTSKQITQNGTHDTTTNNEVIVAIPEPIITQKTITENGTYNASSDSADGYNIVTVNVSGGGGEPVSDNDLLFHFNSDFKNSGNYPAVFNDIDGLGISNEQSKFGSTSLKTRNGQHRNNLTLLPGFDFGSDDFTIDFWCYPTNLQHSSSTGAKTPFSGNYRSIGFYLSETDANIAIAYNENSWAIDYTGEVSINNNQWVHIAFVRNQTECYFFINGIKMFTLNVGTNSITPIKTFTIGSNSFSDGDRRFNGYIDELRLIRGVAAWVDNFTPPTTPYT